MTTRRQRINAATCQICGQCHLSPCMCKVGWYDRTLGPSVLNAGIKHDSEKLPLDLLPFDALEEVTEVLKFGAKKYARRNWERGIPVSRLIGATLRHLFSYMQGETKDLETGRSHLAHAACEILFALAFECRGRTDLDDRTEPDGRPLCR